MKELEKNIIRTIVITIFFTLEAFIHYSIGKTGRISLVVPPKKEVFKVVIVVIFFAALSSLISYMFIKDESNE